MRRGTFFEARSSEVPGMTTKSRTKKQDETDADKMKVEVYEKSYTMGTDVHSGSF